MAVIVTKKIEVVIEGEELRQVDCEKCQTTYFYQLARIGTGIGTALYYLGQKGARRRAETAAKQDLARRLKQDAELVPCPKCHWINQHLVVGYRNRLYRGALKWGFGILAIGILTSPIVFILLVELLGHQTPRTAAPLWTLLLIYLSAPAWMLYIRNVLRSRVNPNRWHPARPRIPPATPPALLPQTDPITGHVHIKPVPQPKDPGPGGPIYAVFRPGQFNLPPICCCCLAVATTNYAPPLAVNERSDLPVPICRTCASVQRRRWWLVLLLVTAASFLLGSVLAALAPGIDFGGRLAILLIIGLFGSLFGGVVTAGTMSRPYRVKTVDADRGIAAFAARNPQYTNLLISHIDRLDGRDEQQSPV